jgi:hypothetical protein
MAKDRITFAKRQREMERKRKADEKRVRRAQQKQNPGTDGEAQESEAAWSSAEHLVLGIFRKYLMTPGKMLCFSNSDLEAFHLPLSNLTNKGMLVVEKSHGGYSLTDDGFSAMKDGV